MFIIKKLIILKNTDEQWTNNVVRSWTQSENLLDVGSLVQLNL